MLTKFTVEKGIVQKIQMLLENIYESQKISHAEPPQPSLDVLVQRAILKGDPREVRLLSEKITRQCLANLRRK